MNTVYKIDLVTGNRYLFVGVAAISLVGPLIVYTRVSESHTLEELGFHIIPRKARRVTLRYVIAEILIALGAGMRIPLMSVWSFLKYCLANTVPRRTSGGLVRFG